MEPPTTDRSLRPETPENVDNYVDNSSYPRISGTGFAAGLRISGTVFAHKRNRMHA